MALSGVVVLDTTTIEEPFRVEKRSTDGTLDTRESLTLMTIEIPIENRVLGKESERW